MIDFENITREQARGLHTSIQMICNEDYTDCREDPTSTQWVNQLVRGCENFSGGGVCPVQATGTLFGHPFYYRERGGRATLSVSAIGTDPVDYDQTLWYAHKDTPESETGAWFDTFCQLVLQLKRCTEYGYLLRWKRVDGTVESIKIWADDMDDLDAQVRHIATSGNWQIMDADGNVDTDKCNSLITNWMCNQVWCDRFTETAPHQDGPEPVSNDFDDDVAFLDAYLTWCQPKIAHERISPEEADTRVWPEIDPDFGIDAPASWWHDGALVTPWAATDEEHRHNLWWDAICHDNRVLAKTMCQQYLQRHPDLDPQYMPHAMSTAYSAYLALAKGEAIDECSRSRMNQNDDVDWILEQLNAALDANRDRYAAILAG